MNLTLEEAIKNRRSIYGISNEAIATDEKIQEIIAFAVANAPTAFNSQSARVVLLLDGEHRAFWDMTTDELKKMSGDRDFTATEQKMQAFANGYGTVLFYEDKNVVKGLQEQFPSYSEKFPDYALQSSGMLQYIVWTTLASVGFGATLQHYNPIVDAPVQAKWDIPENWELIAQMPFGKVIAPAGEKQTQPLEERIKVFK